MLKSFFFLCFGFDFGTSDRSGCGLEFDEFAFAGACRRELKVVMNSIAGGESPSKFLRCSAPASFDNVSVYEIICFNDSSSRGSSFDSWGSAHFSRAILRYSKLLSVSYPGNVYLSSKVGIHVWLLECLGDMRAKK